eukprot:2907503-Ditylum_brightwellii.AAC.1
MQLPGDPVRTMCRAGQSGGKSPSFRPFKCILTVKLCSLLHDVHDIYPHRHAMDSNQQLTLTQTC